LFFLCDDKLLFALQVTVIILQVVVFGFLVTHSEKKKRITSWRQKEKLLSCKRYVVELSIICTFRKLILLIYAAKFNFGGY
jgi:uncharacterized membrane protein (DUF373 family)